MPLILLGACRTGARAPASPDLQDQGIVVALTLLARRYRQNPNVVQYIARACQKAKAISELDDPHLTGISPHTPALNRKAPAPTKCRCPAPCPEPASIGRGRRPQSPESFPTVPDAANRPRSRYPEWIARPA